MRYLTIILTLFLLITTSLAQETENLNMPYRLYFMERGQGNNISYVQTTNTPIEAFSTDATIYQFGWSPDMSHIFVLVNVNGETVARIYDNNFVLANQYTVNLYGHRVSFPIVWSEDSQNIMVIQKNEAGEAIISIMPIGSEQNIQNIEIPLESSSRIQRVYWSPNSSVFAYQTSDMTSSVSDFTSDGQPREFRLYLFNLLNKAVTKVAETSFVGCIAWSYDNSQLAYVENRTRDEDYPYFLRSHSLVIYQPADDTKQLIDLPQDGLHGLDCPLAWSRQGERIALSDYLATPFDESNYDPSQNGISVIHIETEEVEHVFYTEGEPYASFNMSWSPDDTWIATQANYAAFSDIRLINYERRQEYVIRLDGIPIGDPVWLETNNHQ